MAPDNWRGEIIKFPLKFAPSLKYSGTEYVRFAPGWGTENAKDYFSYTFLWETNENPKLSTKKLESEMETYFDGLMSMIHEMSTESQKEINPSKAFFEKINDSIYIGKVITYDAFITKKDVTLNIIVNYEFCDLAKKHLAKFNLSPQSPDHSIWKKMDNIVIDKPCE
ncbi:hypothetical protein [Aquimarina sp. AU474]|uniref:hypothetical protein n=1 Tax=Aquimarina sp. AU474 TaxID=2108529 RepID=UPI00135985DF|nr:hypothetical protein [Aquimarina sp. AU474]